MRFLHHYVVLLQIVLCLTATASDRLEPIAEGSGATKLVRLHVVNQDSVLTLIAEVNQASFDKLPVSTNATLSAATYRLSADSKKCEAYSSIGQAFKASSTQIGILLDKRAKVSSKLIADRLGSQDALKKHALLLYPQKAGDAEMDYSNKTVASFADSMQPRINSGGLIAYPVQLGYSNKATTCKCKSFFGCTTDCCTNPTCVVSPIGSFCQSNDHCKKIDLLSACTCQE